METKQIDRWIGFKRSADCVFVLEDGVKYICSPDHHTATIFLTDYMKSLDDAERNKVSDNPWIKFYVSEYTIENCLFKQDFYEYIANVTGKFFDSTLFGEKGDGLFVSGMGIFLHHRPGGYEEIREHNGDGSFRTFFRKKLN